MTSENDQTNELVRVREFDASGPIELDLSNSIGPVEVQLSETDTVRVEVRHDPSSGHPDWRSGLSGLLSWVGEQIGESGIKPGNGRDGTGFRDRAAGEADAEAVRQTRIDMTGSRLAVHPPTSVPLRSVPLAVTVLAPNGSQVGVRTGAGTVTIDGDAGRTQIQTGSGSVLTGPVTKSATIRTGSGQVRLGTMHGGVHARSGSGPVEIAAIRSASSVVTGSGDVWLGAVESDVLVRSGSGNVTVADTASGSTELITGSGELRVAVRKGVHAEVDITSSTGETSSELAVATEPAVPDSALRIYGRTGSGQAVLTSAV